MKQVLFSAGVVSALTLLTNLLGFVRELLFARAFGASREADCFVAAFSIVATCFLVLAGGALQGAFMPRYQKAIVDNQNAVAKGVWRIGLIGICVFAGGLISVVFFGAETVVSWVVPGFDQNATLLTVQVLIWLLPMILFMSLGTLFQSILHAHHSFALPALVPAGNNVVLIAALVLLVPSYGLVAIGYGTVVGAALWLLLIPPVLRCLPGEKATVELVQVRELLAAILPLIVLLGIDQVSGLIQKTLVSGLEVGSIAVLNYAARLEGLPVGIFAGALTAVMFPALVEVAARNDKIGLEERFRFGVGAISFLLVPSAAFLIVASELVVRVLLERGSFDSDATVRTADALKYYSIGLLAQGLIVYLNRVYFALGDTRTPMFVGIVTAILHVIFCWIAVNSVGYLGIAIGTTFYAIAYLLVLLIFLRNIIQNPIFSLARAVWRPVVGSFALALVSAFFDFPATIAGFIFSIIACGAVYLGVAYLLRDPILKSVRSRFWK